MTGNGDKIDWQTLIRWIGDGRCTPIISDRVGRRRYFADYDDLTRAWAEAVGYPLADRHNLTRVAQYASYVGRRWPDPNKAKRDYLDFLKAKLLAIARQAQPPGHSDFLNDLQRELGRLRFSQVPARLGLTQYENRPDDPLRILAELPLPIYLTTSFTTYMEDALRAAGKTPHTDLCCWNPKVRSEARSVFEEDPDYEPCEKEPLVFHLHGLDDKPASLVLSEDDYLDFLVKVSRDKGSQDPETIPGPVNVALTHTSLLLLGYRLHDWDFRVLFRGVITPRRDRGGEYSVSIQLMPVGGATGPEAAQEYLESYFGNAQFEIYWGDAQSFVRELWEQWEGEA